VGLSKVVGSSKDEADTDMWSGTPLFPESASTMSGRVDALYFFLLAIAVFFSLLIAGLILVYAVKYRRRAPNSVGAVIQGGTLLEIVWIVIPSLITVVIFVWGASVFFAIARPPGETLNVYVVGKQWMWKFQHLDGQREINELHVPVGRAVKLIMTSEDVVHDVFVPAFRVKADVLPGRYTTLWFQATRPGRYRLVCSQYCGTRHSGMTGEVVVMEPAEYQIWLSGGTASKGAAEGSLASAGEKLFGDLACNTCHRPDAPGRGPVLVGLFGKTVTTQNGNRVTVDEAYVRESILRPSATIAAGYQPIMPTFQGLVSEEQLLQLIEYVKSLQAQPEAPTAHLTTAGQAPREATH
jgi:cytochrome c oxidase subunit 2